MANEKQRNNQQKIKTRKSRLHLSSFQLKMQLSRGHDERRNRRWCMRAQLFADNPARKTFLEVAS